MRLVSYSSPASGGNVTSPHANKLALYKSFSTALCTTVMCSEQEASSAFETTWNNAKSDNENNVKSSEDLVRKSQEVNAHIN